MTSLPACIKDKLDNMQNLFNVDFIAVFLANGSDRSFHLIDQ